jgi:phosphoadenosine phosphosulfate reductase
MPGLTTQNAVPLQLPLSPESLQDINDYLSTLTPQEILRWGVAHLPNLYQTTAFGITGIVAIDMLSKITRSPPPLIFFDTLYHFPETYDLVKRIEERYDVQVEFWRPEGCETVDDFEAKYGMNLWSRDEDLYDRLVKVCPTSIAYFYHYRSRRLR